MTDDGFQPTCQLRFVKKWITDIFRDTHEVKILQQLWTKYIAPEYVGESSAYEFEWRDVPEVNE